MHVNIFFPPVVGYLQLYGILGGGWGGLTCTWRVRWGCSRIKLLKETNLGVNPCPPVPLHLNRQQARESVRGVNKGW